MSILFSARSTEMILLMKILKKNCMPIFLLFVKNQRVLHCQLVELIITFTFCACYQEKLP